MVTAGGKHLKNFGINPFGSTPTYGVGTFDTNPKDKKFHTVRDTSPFATSQIELKKQESKLLNRDYNPKPAHDAFFSGSRSNITEPPPEGSPTYGVGTFDTKPKEKKFHTVKDESPFAINQTELKKQESKLLKLKLNKKYISKPAHDAFFTDNASSGSRSNVTEQAPKGSTPTYGDGNSFNINPKEKKFHTVRDTSDFATKQIELKKYESELLNKKYIPKPKPAHDAFSGSQAPKGSTPTYGVSQNDSTKPKDKKFHTVRDTSQFAKNQISLKKHESELLNRDYNPKPKPAHDAFFSDDAFSGSRSNIGFQAPKGSTPTYGVSQDDLTNPKEKKFHTVRDTSQFAKNQISLKKEESELLNKKYIPKPEPAQDAFSGPRCKIKKPPKPQPPSLKSHVGRVGSGDPGKETIKGKNKSGISYSLSATSKEMEAIDKITALPMYKGQTHNPNLAINDLVKFRIAVIDNSPGANATYIHFRAFIDSFTDNYSADWGSVNYVGRGDNFWNYTGFKRDISLGFTVAAQSKPELIPMYKKLNYLASTLAPDYSTAGLMRGNLVRLTVGGYIYEQPGIITTLNYGIPEESPWEIGIDENGGKDSSVKELPHIIKVSSFSFTPIHNFLVEKADDHHNPKAKFISIANGKTDANTNYPDEYLYYNRKGGTSDIETSKGEAQFPPTSPNGGRDNTPPTTDNEIKLNL
jgi:hypothetical protein